MSLNRILVVEDEKSHQLIIKKALDHQYDIDFASSYGEGLAKINSQKNYDLVLLDVLLPDGDGFELCAQMKMKERYSNTAVIFLSSKEEVKSKVLGFSLGADDYIVKPCDPLELRARVDSRIKKNKDLKQGANSLIEGDLYFELDKQMVSVKDGQGPSSSVDLTPLEFRLLYYLAKNKDIVMSRNQILEGVWGQGTHVLDRSVDTYIASLRRKLKLRGTYIRSIHGVGYKFSAERKSQRAS